MPVLNHMELQRDRSSLATVVEVHTHLRPSNQLTHTHHTLEFWGVRVAEDMYPVLDKSRLNSLILISSQRKRTINRVRGHILETEIDTHAK